MTESAHMSTGEPSPVGDRTVLVLLAAGAGRRFRESIGSPPPDTAGDHKLMAALHDLPLAVHALRSALATGLQVVVVTGAEPRVADLARQAAADMRAAERLTVTHNPGWAAGQASSLVCGLAVAAAQGATAAVVGLADQPFITESAWKAVAASHASIAVATYDGVRGHPVRLAVHVWDRLPSTGDSGARDLMRLRPDLVEEVPCQGSADDVDTLEDLQRWS